MSATRAQTGFQLVSSVTTLAALVWYTPTITALAPLVPVNVHSLKTRLFALVAEIAILLICHLALFLENH